MQLIYCNNKVSELTGLQPVDAIKLIEYERAMREEGIPEIIKALKKRQILAAKARQRIL